MKFATIIVAIYLSIVSVYGQYFGRPGLGFGYSSLTGDFGGPSAFGSYGGGDGSYNVRDSRQDRGPVVFPPPPQDGPMETSGVIVGASGFGFVPPNGH